MIKLQQTLVNDLKTIEEAIKSLTNKHTTKCELKNATISELKEDLAKKEMDQKFWTVNKKYL